MFSHGQYRCVDFRGSPKVLIPPLPMLVIRARFRTPGRPRPKYPKNAKYFFYQRERRQAKITQKNVYRANGVTVAPRNFAIQDGLPFGTEQKNAAPIRSHWKSNVVAEGLHGEARFRLLVAEPRKPVLYIEICRVTGVGPAGAF